MDKYAPTAETQMVEVTGIGSAMSSNRDAAMHGFDNAQSRGR